ncbi:MAG: LppX_LprAFG lipoprotein [Chloroflexi bacterium]|nr:LppX_LprAFG lipoprotein [Chloroflexota bacterium]
MAHDVRFLSLIAVISITLVGCGGGAAAPTAIPTPTPTPAEISARAGQATRAAESMAFAITLGGQPVYSDPSRVFMLTAIDGALRRPDGVLATLKLRSAAGLTEVRTVSLAGKQYATNPLTRAWQCLAPGTAFDAAVLFDPQRGIEQLLQDGIENVALVGEEELDGRPVYHLRGAIPAERMIDISGGLIGAGAVTVDIWADRETLRLAKIMLVDQVPGAAEATTWTLVFNKYDQPVDVRAPVEC